MLIFIDFCLKPVRLEKKQEILSFFFNFIYSFDGERDSQWEREHKQGEWERKKQAPSKGPWCGYSLLATVCKENTIQEHAFCLTETATLCGYIMISEGIYLHRTNSIWEDFSNPLSWEPCSTEAGGTLSDRDSPCPSGFWRMPAVPGQKIPKPFIHLSSSQAAAGEIYS